jgi:hypothetical protein
VDRLLEKNRRGTISPAESAELDEFERFERVVRMLKARSARNRKARPVVQSTAAALV